MQELAKAFERDKTYTEKEVNILLADFHDDFCTLRRDLVGAGLMAREKGLYWRVSNEEPLP